MLFCIVAQIHNFIINVSSLKNAKLLVILRTYLLDVDEETFPASKKNETSSKNVYCDTNLGGGRRIVKMRS